MVSLTIDVDRTKGANSKSRSDSNGANSNEAGNRLILFTFIQGLIKEIYRGDTFSFCGYLGKDITNKPSKKTVIINMIFYERKISKDAGLKKSFNKKIYSSKLINAFYLLYCRHK